MSLTIDVERLAEAGRRHRVHMDLDDAAAMKLCLLSAGALAGLSLKGRTARRIMGLGCAVLTAGLGIPLAAQYLDELADTPLVPEDLAAEEADLEPEPEGEAPQPPVEPLDQEG